MHCWTCWWICLTCRCAKSQSSASVRSPANATKREAVSGKQAQIDANQQKAELSDRLKMETTRWRSFKINAEADSMDARTLKDSLMAVFTSLESGAVLELGAAKSGRPQPQSWRPWTSPVAPTRLLYPLHQNNRRQRAMYPLTC